MLTEQIKGYLISHAHMDHVAGLVIASPDDAMKPIYGLPSVCERHPEQLLQLGGLAEFRHPAAMSRNSRNTNSPTLVPGEQRDLAGTAMQVTAYPLSHGGVGIRPLS